MPPKFLTHAQQANLSQVNASLVSLQEEIDALLLKKEAIARDILLQTVFPQLHWNIDPEEASLHCSEAIGDEMFALFGDKFSEGRYHLSLGPSGEGDRVAHDLLAWLRDRGLLAFDEADDASMFNLFQQETQNTTPGIVSMSEDVWLDLDESGLHIRAPDVGTLLEFLARYNLQVGVPGKWLSQRVFSLQGEPGEA